MTPSNEWNPTMFVQSVQVTQRWRINSRDEEQGKGKLDCGRWTDAVQRVIIIWFGANSRVRNWMEARRTKV
jgi:hypothetical protein